MTINSDILAVLFPLLLLSFGLGFIEVIDPYLQRKQRFSFGHPLDGAF